MAKHTMNHSLVSSGQDEGLSEPDEMQAFHHNALRVLGDNYLIRKWLPLKGPAFIALIQAMRCHIYYDFASGEQKTRYFPEAATIAKLAGISRAQVFRLLNDPDMPFFIRRINRRRYSAEHQRELQTSNLYLVAMDDPPTPEDEHLVIEAQRRIDAINRGEDPDAPPRSGRSTTGKSSESQFETLRAVSNRDSQSSIKLRLEDRSTINQFDGGDISITQSEGSGNVARLAIGRTGEQIRISETKQTNQTMKQERSAEQAHQTKMIAQKPNSEADRIEPIEESKEVPKHRTLVQMNESQDTPGLSEGEAWKAAARGWLTASRLPAHIGQPQGHTILEHHMAQFAVENAPAAIEALLTYAAPILSRTNTPVEILADLAEQARRRTNLYVHKINADGSPATTNPGGYYLNVLRSIISEYGKTRDLAKLEKKTAKMETTDIAAGRAATGLPARKTAPGQTLADVFQQQRAGNSATRSRASAWV